MPAAARMPGKRGKTVSPISREAALKGAKTPKFTKLFPKPERSQRLKEMRWVWENPVNPKGVEEKAFETTLRTMLASSPSSFYSQLCSLEKVYDEQVAEWKEKVRAYKRSRMGKDLKDQAAADVVQVIDRLLEGLGVMPPKLAGEGK